MGSNFSDKTLDEIYLTMKLFFVCVKAENFLRMWIRLIGITTNLGKNHKDIVTQSDSNLQTTPTIRKVSLMPFTLKSKSAPVP